LKPNFLLIGLKIVDIVEAADLVRVMFMMCIWVDPCFADEFTIVSYSSKMLEFNNGVNEKMQREVSVESQCLYAVFGMTEGKARWG
jgi:hypothetical protein